MLSVTDHLSEKWSWEIIAFINTILKAPLRNILINFCTFCPIFIDFKKHIYYMLLFAFLFTLHENSIQMHMVKNGIKKQKF